jgi:hypothetical protein
MRGRITPNKKVSSPTLCSSSGYSAENTAIVTPTAGACKTGFTLTELGAEGKEGKAVRAQAEGSLSPTGSESEVYHRSRSID